MIQLTDGPTLWRALKVRDANEVELFRIPWTSIWCVWRRKEESDFIDESTRRRVYGPELAARAQAAARRRRA